MSYSVLVSPITLTPRPKDLISLRRCWQQVLSLVWHTTHLTLDLFPTSGPKFTFFSPWIPYRNNPFDIYERDLEPNKSRYLIYVTLNWRFTRSSERWVSHQAVGRRYRSRFSRNLYVLESGVVFLVLDITYFSRHTLDTCVIPNALWREVTEGKDFPLIRYEWRWDNEVSSLFFFF